MTQEFINKLLVLGSKYNWGFGPKIKDSQELDEAIKDYFQGLWPGTETAEQCNTDMHFTPLAIMRLAKHFYNLGKEAEIKWLTEQFELIKLEQNESK